MKEQHIIVTETQRPFWQLIIAALLFTVCIALTAYILYTAQWSLHGIESTIYNLGMVAFIAAFAIGFCSQKRVYINLKESKFKPSLEIGFIKIGKWVTIDNYEYVSIFYDPSKSEAERFEVNLWYDRNKHFELYTRNNFEDAIVIGFEISEQLNIDLLDATIKNDHKWIDKKALKLKQN